MIIYKENWRKTYEAQFSQMGVNKASLCGQLSPLRYDASNENDKALDVFENTPDID